ncbi:hypothetical protein ACEZDB_32440 [Streptacidiphilus sp. N1-3]|uniref:HTH luxR-type domain-containing protein n=1 Tax=Streptacidiphilus alkalitolerans TaxID=3342712 RepID=A0ABV6XAR6_9ACTN
MIRWFDEDDYALIRRYKEGTSISALAREYGTDRKALRSRLRRLGVTLRAPNAPSTLLRRNAARLPKGMIKLQYLHPMDPWTQSELATHYGTGTQTIRRILVDQGVEIRSRKQALEVRRDGMGIGKVPDDLVSRYIKIGETLPDLAHLCGLPVRALRREFDDWQMRTAAESRSLLHRHLRQLSERQAEVISAYQSGVSTADLAALHNVGEMTVIRLLGGVGILPPYPDVVGTQASGSIEQPDPADDGFLWSDWTTLSSNHRRVMLGLCIGLDNLGMTDMATRGVLTVRNARSTLMQHFGVSTSRQVAAWGVVSGMVTAEQVLGALNGTPRELTGRQRVLAAYVMTGASKDATAADFGISSRTVGIEQDELLELLGARTLAQGAAVAMALGLAPMDLLSSRLPALPWPQRPWARLDLPAQPASPERRP